MISATWSHLSLHTSFGAYWTFHKPIQFFGSPQTCWVDYVEWKEEADELSPLTGGLARFKAREVAALLRWEQFWQWEFKFSSLPLLKALDNPCKVTLSSQKYLKFNHCLHFEPRSWLTLGFYPHSESFSSETKQGLAQLQDRLSAASGLLIRLWKQVYIFLCSLWLLCSVILDCTVANSLPFGQVAVSLVWKPESQSPLRKMLN